MATTGDYRPQVVSLRAEPDRIWARCRLGMLQLDIEIDRRDYQRFGIDLHALTNAIERAAYEQLQRAGAWPASK